MEVDIALQYDGAREPHASRHNQMTAALLRQSLDGFGKGFGREPAARSISPEIAETHFCVWNGWCLQFGHGEGQILRVLLIRVLTVSTVGRVLGEGVHREGDEDHQSG